MTKNQDRVVTALVIGMIVFLLWAIAWFPALGELVDLVRAAHGRL